MDDRDTIGANKPPTPIAFSAETAKALSAWMAEHPVIDSEDTARAGKLLYDRGKTSIEEMEIERRDRCRPLEQRVHGINDEYKSPRNLIERVTYELLARLQAFTRAEEARRRRAADEAKKIAAEKEREAREAERQEREAKENAKVGELGTDIATATQAADEKFAEYEKAEREAQRAERDQRVKIGGGFKRALSLRTTEVIVIDDVHKAIDSIGMVDKIKDAIISAARDYRKEFKELPDGISSVQER